MSVSSSSSLIAMRQRLLDAAWVWGLTEAQLTRVDRDTQVVYFACWTAW
jgi:hypothetical protein